MSYITNKRRRAALGDVSNEVDIQKNESKRKCTLSGVAKSAGASAKRTFKPSEAAPSVELDQSKVGPKLKKLPKANASAKVRVACSQKPATSRKSCNVAKLCSPIQKLCVNKKSKEKSTIVKKEIKSGKASTGTLSDLVPSSTTTTITILPTLTEDTRDCASKEVTEADTHKPSIDATSISNDNSSEVTVKSVNISAETFTTESLSSIINLKLSEKKSSHLSTIPVPTTHSSTSITHSTSIHPPILPPSKLDWVDIDSAQHDLYYMSEYASDIFEYYKTKELQHRIPDYISQQDDITTDMRMVLVDWLVEVQQSFELNHESLYTAVKLLDTFASRRSVGKTRLQLLGAVALNLASKFEERCPPAIDDFVFICDDAYSKQEFLLMEMEVLTVCGFKLSMPLSYTFLRRFAMCARVNLETLTLARFFLETSLLHYRFIIHLESKMAASCLLLAMLLNQEGSWDATTVHYTGYSSGDLHDQVLALNHAINHTPDHLTTVLNKYSHPIFQSVATKPRLSQQQLLTLLSSLPSP